MKHFTAILLAVIVAATLFVSVSHAASYETTVKAWVSMRTAPNTASAIITSLRPNERIHVVRKENSYWLYVQTQSGKYGYISANSRYTNYQTAANPDAPISPNSKIESVVRYALSLQGKVTYSYGVRNPSRMIFDCSSFTQYAFNSQGITIPWGSKAQSQIGGKIGFQDLKRGDLIIFSNVSNRLIGHVGIYLGNGEFVHNLPKNSVVISSLNDYWTKRFIQGNRVI